MATLYLRAVPDNLVREAKAAAARRGITLTTLVSEALARTLETDGGKPADLPAGLRAEAAWYDAHRVRLARRYRGQYLAIVGQRVVDHDRDFSALARRVFKRYGVRPIYLPKCVDGGRVVNIPSPRVAGA